jgi:hypothetical protein
VASEPFAPGVERFLGCLMNLRCSIEFGRRLGRNDARTAGQHVLHDGPDRRLIAPVRFLAIVLESVKLDLPRIWIVHSRDLLGFLSSPEQIERRRAKWLATLRDCEAVEQQILEASGWPELNRRLEECSATTERLLGEIIAYRSTSAAGILIKMRFAREHDDFEAEAADPGSGLIEARVLTSVLRDAERLASGVEV